MSSSKQGHPIGGTTLNPNAAAFVPFSHRGGSGSSNVAVLDRSKSSVSDEAAHQYWEFQLPDDITPDFKVTGEGEDESLQVGNPLSLAGLSLHETNSFSTAAGSSNSSSAYMFNGQQHHASSLHASGAALLDNVGYSKSVYASGHPNMCTPWETQVLGSDNKNIGSSFDDEYPNHMIGQSSVIENNMNPLDFLASQFPGFAAESLAEVYIATGCDLNLTIDMLTQLELQVDGGCNQNMNSKILSTPNLTSMDFPALPVQDNKSHLPKDDLQQTAYQYGSEKENMLLFKSRSSLTAKGASDFASTVRKLASQDSGLWKYDRNGSGDVTIGSSRGSQTLSASYNSAGTRNPYADRQQGRGTTRAAPIWLETGDAVANLYSELREDARDHARIRNVYFEQARQAYLIGNKALAKELSVKGQLHNMQMKAAHNRAQESIYRQRNPVSSEHGGGRGGQEKIIDLHGLHVSEAIHVLRNELSVLSKAARSAEQRLHVYICVGTGHHTKGSRTPARLPVAIQRYLLEEEGLDYTEPQPGLLRVVLY